MTKKTKVLFITNCYPPIGGAGILRIIKLIKYLDKYRDIEITLIKPYYTGGDSISYTKLTDEIPLTVNIITIGNRILRKFYQLSISSINVGTNRINNEKVKKRFLIRLLQQFVIPDKYIILIIPFLLKLVNMNIKPDVIISSSPPNSIHLLGIIAKLIFKSKLIIDFRDGWTIRPLKIKRNLLFERINKLIELFVIKRSNAIVTVTPPLVDYFKRYKNKNVYYIPNGYDPDDFKSGINDMCEKANRKDLIKIAYAGGLPKHRNIETLFKVLGESDLFRNKITIDLWGIVSKYHLDNIYKYKLEKNVFYKGEFSHSDVARKLSSYDFLLLIGQIGPGGETNYSSKIFEYIALTKPIIGLVPDSPAKDLILQNKIGVVASPDNYNEIKALLLDVLNHKFKFNINSANNLKIKFNRKKIAEEYYHLIKKMVSINEKNSNMY